jgi:xanthine dehydrogenase YagS FAD-binding subunit
VVDIKNVASMRGVTPDGDGVAIGVLTTLDELLASPLLADYRSLADVVDGIRAIQIRQNGTIGGDLCHLPNCWYFRNGYGLLGMEGSESVVELGDNRYHAILGNDGPAKHVNASRFAPSLIAWGARVRIIGPEPDQQTLLPLEEFYVTPRTDQDATTRLEPGQLVSHIWLPAAGAVQSATYEVLQLQGLDWPLAAAAACLELEAGHVRDARIVLGHVAPTPWVSPAAAIALRGKSITELTAQHAGEAAVAEATPLSDNEYKVQLAQTAVKRAVLRAAGQLEGNL